MLSATEAAKLCGSTAPPKATGITTGYWSGLAAGHTYDIEFIPADANRHPLPNARVAASPSAGAGSGSRPEPRSGHALAGAFGRWRQRAEASVRETLADRHPDAGLWPKDWAARAMARSYAAEMHSGFPDLRDQLSMDFARTLKLPELLGSAGHGVRGQALVGAICAAFMTLLAVKFLLRYFKTNRLTVFGIYCIGLGVASTIAFAVN